MKIIITFCCANLWKSKFVTLEKHGKLSIFFSYFVATLCRNLVCCINCDLLALFLTLAFWRLGERGETRKWKEGVRSVEEREGQQNQRERLEKAERRAESKDGRREEKAEEGGSKFGST